MATTDYDSWHSANWIEGYNGWKAKTVITADASPYGPYVWYDDKTDTLMTHTPEGHDYPINVPDLSQTYDPESYNLTQKMHLELQYKAQMAVTNGQLEFIFAWGELNDIISAARSR